MTVVLERIKVSDPGSFASDNSLSIDTRDLPSPKMKKTERKRMVLLKYLKI